MENFFSALKLLGPIMLTPIINRLISTFRVRQLYLSFEDAQPCSLPETDGYITNIRIYNKGKDKENKVEAIFPSTSLCQVISTNYPGITADENKVTVDRILPKQIVIFTLYTRSPLAMSNENKPFLKSEDANGKSFNARVLVPASLGPAVMAASITIASLLTFAYVMMSDISVLRPYYSVRYKQFTEQGFRPASFSDNKLISSVKYSSTPPIIINKPYIENSQITIPLQLKNPTNEKITISVHQNLTNPEYRLEYSKATNSILDSAGKVQAWNVIDKKYGFAPDDKLYFETFALSPREEKTILLKKSVIETTTLGNFNFTVSVDGADNSEFSDYYLMNIEDSSQLGTIKELIKTLRP